MAGDVWGKPVERAQGWLRVWGSRAWASRRQGEAQPSNPPLPARARNVFHSFRLPASQQE